jgi:antiviral helicase SKI2
MEKHANLKRKLQSLRFAVSDENLQLMPEFQTRVVILQQLHYIDEDKNVLLKGALRLCVECVYDPDRFHQDGLRAS